MRDVIDHKMAAIKIIIYSMSDDMKVEVMTNETFREPNRNSDHSPNLPDSLVH